MTKRSFYWALLPFILLIGGLPAIARSEGPPAAVSATLDQRVATIGHRLAVANLDLCADRQWLAGVVLHDLSQYPADFRPTAIRDFGLDEGPAVLAVAVGGPAERSGLHPGDILLRLDGRPLPRLEMGSLGSFDTMEAILAALEVSFADGHADFEVRRTGALLSIPVNAEPGCATRFQVIHSGRLTAYADGRYVQVTTAIGDFVVDDDELAAVLAHEFAHNVLRHRARLDAAGVARGLLGNFGRNARLIRETEAEADRLSIYLLDRAGFDPEPAVRLWSRLGRHGLNFLGSPTHGSWRTRVALMQAEVAAVRRARAAGAVPVPPFSFP